MIHSEDIRWPHCFGNNLQKNGKSCNSIQRWYTGRILVEIYLSVNLRHCLLLNAVNQLHNPIGEITDAA